MRYLERPETSITSTGSSKQHTGVTVMEYSEGGGNQEGQYHQEGQQQSSKSYEPSQESRQQPQHHHLHSQPAQVPWPAQQQQSLYPQQQQIQQQQLLQQQSYNPHQFPHQPSDASTISHAPGDFMGMASSRAPQQASHQQYMAPGYPTTSPGYNSQYVQELNYRQQQMAMQQSMAMGTHASQQSQPLLHSHQHVPPPPRQQPLQTMNQPYLQPKLGRLPADRPIIKLSVSLIDTYKTINTVYYEERDARRAARAKDKQKKGQGTNNNGWDDENYDYLISPGELFYGRYRIKERIGKGSFGQVVRAEDINDNRDVAIKIIKSKKPFLMQAKTEIELLSHLNEKDPSDENNIGTFHQSYVQINDWMPSSHSFRILQLSSSFDCALYVP